MEIPDLLFHHAVHLRFVSKLSNHENEKQGFALKCYLCSVCVCNLLNFRAGGLALWFPDIVNRLSNNDVGRQDTLCKLLEVKPTGGGLIGSTCDATISTNMYIGTMLIGVFYFLGFAVTALAMPKLGSGLVMGT
jgi:hypothetical protein